MRSTALVLAASFVLLPAFACSDSHPIAGGTGGSSAGTGGASGGSGGIDGNAACVIPPPAAVQLPHVDATGTKAADVVNALVAILSSQMPAISPGQMYRIDTLGCGGGCAFQVQIDGGPSMKVSIGQASPLAQTLYDALAAAGAVPCGGDGKSGPSVNVANLTATTDQLHFDDVSHDAPLPAPEVVATGSAAQGVVAAFAAAAVNDCDPSRKVFVTCNNLSGRPSCAYQATPLEKVGSSWLRNICQGANTTMPHVLGPDPSLAMWRAILAAAQAGGFQPTRGTLEQTNSVDARYFTWDGVSLGFSLGTSTLAQP
ncbi:MAG: hypothetical protein QOI66_3726 [Myxococcales bacterium]|nr:hypothetical protein [Myxococcales bacterium]